MPRLTEVAILLGKTKSLTRQTSLTTKNCVTASRAFFLKAIREDMDLTDHMSDAVNSLRIVLAADESVRTGEVVAL